MERYERHKARTLQRLLCKSNNHLMKNYGVISTRKFGDSTLFKDLRHALMVRNPPTTIICALLVFRLFCFVLELMPVWTQYYLLDWMFELGFKWWWPQIGHNDIREQKATEFIQQKCSHLFHLLVIVSSK